jgi:hypothetical protein
MTMRIGIDLSRDLAQLCAADLGNIRNRLRRQAAEQINEYRLLDQAAYSYEIVPISHDGIGAIRFAEASIDAPRLIPDSGDLSHVGAAACTLGPAISLHTSALFETKKASIALALDELANKLLFAIIRRMLDRLLGECQRRGLSLGVELHAGEPGLDINAQALVCRLAQAERIGIALHHEIAMTPLKSRSILVGIGQDLPVTSWTRCTDCPTKHKCAHGRRGQLAATHPISLP